MELERERWGMGRTLSPLTKSISHTHTLYTYYAFFTFLNDFICKSTHTHAIQFGDGAFLLYSLPNFIIVSFAFALIVYSMLHTHTASRLMYHLSSSSTSRWWRVFFPVGSFIRSFVFFLLLHLFEWNARNTHDCDDDEDDDTAEGEKERQDNEKRMICNALTECEWGTDFWFLPRRCRYVEIYELCTRMSTLLYIRFGLFFYLIFMSCDEHISICINSLTREYWVPFPKKKKKTQIN